MSGVCNSTFWPFPPPPPPGSKVNYHLCKVNFKVFIPNFLYVLTNKRYKTYRMGFSLCRLGLGVAWGQNFIFSKHGHVAYQIEGDCEQNGIQVKCSPYGQPSDLEMESIGQLSLNFFESVGCLRWHPIHYAITRTDVSKFGDCF